MMMDIIPYDDISIMIPMIIIIAWWNIIRQINLECNNYWLHYNYIDTNCANRVVVLLQQSFFFTLQCIILFHYFIIKLIYFGLLFLSLFVLYCFAILFLPVVTSSAAM